MAVWLGSDMTRTKDTLKVFFTGTTDEQKQSREATVMNMWDPYIHAVRKHVSHVKSVFDLFYVISSFG